MNCLTEEKRRCFKHLQKYIMCKDAEAIETKIDSGNYEKFSIAGLRRVKRY